MIISISTILKVWAFTSLSLQAQVVAGQDKTAHLRNQKNRQLKNLFAGKSHTPASVNNPNRPDIIARNIPSVDRAKVKAEDAEREARGEPMRFAVTNEVTIDTKSDGSWEAIEGDGTQVWRYRLKSPGCNSMNLGFCEYDMPDGGSLHICEYISSAFPCISLYGMHAHLVSIRSHSRLYPTSLCNNIHR